MRRCALVRTEGFEFVNEALAGILQISEHGPRRHAGTPRELRRLEFELDLVLRQQGGGDLLVEFLLR